MLEFEQLTARKNYLPSREIMHIGNQRLRKQSACIQLTVSGRILDKTS